MTDDILYMVDYHGKEVAEGPDRAKVVKSANEWFAEQSEDVPMRSGDTREAECEIIKFRYDDDGEMVVLSREPHTLNYEYYHGDYAEHNTHWGLR